MIALCAFPLVLFAGVICILAGVGVIDMRDGVPAWEQAATGVFGVLCILFGLWCWRELRRCRDVPGYFRDHYSPFRD